MMISPKKIKTTVRRVLEDDQRVALGYIFGSVARKQTGPLSDIDVGVLPFSEVDDSRFPGKLMDELCRALKTDHVDLVDIASASVPLRYRIIKDGELLLSRDEALRQRFESAAVMNYLDIRPMREQCFRVTRQKILEGSP
jgi:predicted nucleotidyltransferase